MDGAADVDASVGVHLEVQLGRPVDGVPLPDDASDPPLASGVPPATEVRAGRSGRRVLDRARTLGEEQPRLDGLVPVGAQR